jgi:hypothetical protein
VVASAPIFDRNDDGDFVLLPPECPSREELERELTDPIELPGPPPPPPPPQFSLGDVMVLTVGVAVGLAGGSWMPGKAFALLLGLVLLVGLVIVSWHPPQSRLGKVIWTSCVIAYFTALLAAIVRPPTDASP